MTAKLIFASTLAIIVLLFAVQNAAVVEIRLLFWQFAFPRSLLIIVMLLVGVIIGWVGRGVFLHKRQK